MAKPKQQIVIAWQPHPGKQTQFVQAVEDEVFYGGGRGSAKTSSLIALMLKYAPNPNYRGLMLRRTFPQLLEIRDRCYQLYTKIDPGAKFNKDDNRWEFSSGAAIQLGHVQHEEDKYRYQGFEYQMICTEVGTPVLMPNGSYRPVQNLRIGDKVQTLNGPNIVTMVGQPRLAECVLSSTKFGNQVQTTNHALLGAHGKWISYEDLCRIGSSEAKQNHWHYKFYEQFFGMPHIGRQNLGYLYSCPEMQYGQVLLSLGRLDQVDSCVSLGDGRTYYEESGGSHEESLPPPVLFSHVALHVPSLLSGCASVSRESCDARLGQQFLSFLSYYHPYSHFCDELVPFHSNIYQDAIPSQDDVVSQNHLCRRLGVSDSILSHSHAHPIVYEHPYKKVDQLSCDSVADVPCSFTPCGKRFVVDITVENQNHYITFGGFVNKNCFDELTHFTQSQYEFIKLSCRSRDPELRPIIRATGNPGGLGHLWVKSYFVDVATPGTTYVETSDDGRQTTRKYIKATIYDNPTLLENDPNYVTRLKNMPDERLRRMMLDGDWDAAEGLAFPTFNRDIHVKKRYEIFPDTGLPPEGMVIFASLDWGFSKPFAIHWHAIDNYDRILTFDEWYGVKKDPIKKSFMPNVGLQILARDVAKGFVQRCSDMKVQYLVADPSIKAKHGQESGSILQEFQMELADAGIPVLMGNNDRRAGWMQMRSRLSIGPDEKPWWTITDNCIHLIRTIASMPEDPENPEEIPTTLEEHAIDGCRYGLMSVPMKTTILDQQTRVNLGIESYRTSRKDTNNLGSLASTYH